MKYASIFALVFATVLVGILLMLYSSKESKVVDTPPQETITQKQPIRTVLGKSVKGKEIEAYTFAGAEGNKHAVFMGGIHGKYEYNTVQLAHKMLTHLTANQSLIAPNTQVTIIPNLNPDATDRFNANGVDLNRNFDCNWKPKAVWKGKEVSAGTKPFSEPEAQALKNFVDREVAKYSSTKNLADNLQFIFWHSKANAVYASQCNDGVLPATLELMKAYAEASGYKAIESFDAYPVTGAAEDWLASIGVPAITVELATHEELDWERNRKGVEVLLGNYQSY